MTATAEPTQTTPSPATVEERATTSGHRVRGRPLLYTSYQEDMALLNTPTKRWSVLVIVVVALSLAFLIEDDLIRRLSTAFALGIGAIGLNLVTGYAGQVSLGHAFFVGLGAYTGAILSGPAGGGFLGCGVNPDIRTVGCGWPMILWLPLAGLVPAVIGMAIGPIASRLRGLYLAIVTLGLVFLGEHFFTQGSALTGLPGQGRPGTYASIFGFSLVAGTDEFTGAQRTYLFIVVMLVIMAVLGRNLARSDVGRAFAAVRDRDIAAEVIGVRLTRTKVIAFSTSSFFAGISGALLYTVIRTIDPSSFNLGLSVRFIAMILIGGVATISGSIVGALFITLLPLVTDGVLGFLSDVVPGLSGVITTPGQRGGLLNTEQLEQILYGLLIIGFLIFEPRGLYGVWVRIRNYWKGWPFSY